MINQNWLNNKHVKLAYTSISTDKHKSRYGVVLLPGLSHSMCDLDYFMSKLARKLAQDHLYTMQFDPRGHGDSSGNFGEVDLDSLRDDIKSIINHVSNDKTTEHFFCIGRGLTASLLAEFISEPKVKGIIGITPYCVSPIAIRNYWPALKEVTIDTSDFFEGQDYVNYSDFKHETRRLLNALGAMSYNIHGQLFSTKLIIDLYHYEPIIPLKNCKTDGLWLFPAKDRDHLEEYDMLNQNEYPAMTLYHNFSLPRNPMSQYEIINTISQWIINKIEQDADTCSN
jgi:hypothetical protein